MVGDPYERLRLPPPTPIDEVCSCSGAPPLVLRTVFSPNPIGCADCSLEVPPERIGFSRQLAEDLADWRRFYECFDHLWLDSGEFEDWARAQLSDPRSPANVRGLALRKQLDEVRRCYYWWFEDTGSDAFEPLSACPVCNSRLTERGSRLVCEPCGVMVAH